MLCWFGLFILSPFFMYFEWKDEYALGIQEIDAQHKTFVGILNSLYEASLKPDSATEIADIVQQLIGYAGYHFATEEKYFDLFQYEGAEEHKAIHHNLTKRVLELKDEFAQKGQETIPALLDFVEDWLVNHLNTYDKKYAPCFHEHGLT